MCRCRRVRQVCGKLIQVIGGQRRCPLNYLEQETGQVTGRLRLPQQPP